MTGVVIQDPAIPATGDKALRTASLSLVRAYDANVDAINGQGHPGESHDRAIHMDPCTSDPGVHVYSTSTDCAACGGAEYGTEDAIQAAIVAVKLAVGEPLRPYEEHRRPVAPPTESELRAAWGDR